MSDVKIAEQGSQGKLLVPAMVIGTMAVNVSVTILQLFLVDIGKTFDVSVGVASQLATFNHAGELISALLMGFLAVRFKYKSLIMMGMCLVLFSAIGSFLAPDFASMEVFFALEGIGTIMFTVMAQTLIGDSLVPHKRAKAVSYLMAGLFAMGLISSPLSGLIANVWGWRSNFVVLMLPFSIVGLILAFFFIRSSPHREKGNFGKSSFLEKFKQVLTDRSAIACLVAQVLAAAASTRLIYSIAFYREVFSVSRDSTVIISIATLVVFMVGSLISGRLTSRFGAKPVSVTSALITSIFLMMFFFIPNLLSSLAFNFVIIIFVSIGVTSGICLSLAQVPKSRGTMMSLHNAVASLGTTIGPVVGGTLLVLIPGFYGAVGIALGGMIAASAFILFFFAKDQTKT